jgi:hydrogen peroxide-dependent heme synthase
VARSFNQGAPRPVEPTTGWGVLHLFVQAGGPVDRQAVVKAVESLRQDGYQVVPAALLGHKADACLMALGPDLWRLRGFQSEVGSSGLQLVTSYLSLTELSEYAAGLPEEMRQARLFPRLPPDGLRAFCFYPMSKRRLPGQNWYTLDFDARRDLMHNHGAVGRKFRGRVLQLVTGSVGLDDWEWGVTLFGRAPDDLKQCVYEMRFDQASALYAEFGPFYSGIVGELDEVIDSVTFR